MASRIPGLRRIRSQSSLKFHRLGETWRSSSCACAAKTNGLWGWSANTPPSLDTSMKNTENQNRLNQMRLCLMLLEKKILTVLLSALQEWGISGLILSVETTFLISSKLGSGVTYWKQTQVRSYFQLHTILLEGYIKVMQLAASYLQKTDKNILLIYNQNFKFSYSSQM